ncbi:hypothetical protein OJAV_G00032100 [Oryzias javanicus]|uniref:MHC class II-associated invariant chain/CLIP MHC II-interacting domain-containing protein n=1 Tax=Oryzias javanicus TaxID=123683 RepID=A0A437DEP7_ORYJA|nr:hypothetical protein OJAV_G00032100 [Oryzias javanicus]
MQSQRYLDSSVGRFFWDSSKMSDTENTTQPLIGASSHTAVDVAMEERPRPSRAYKIAGFTLLGCVLIVGQAAIAYFLLSQNSDIKSLEEQNNQIKSQLSSGRSAAIPARMHMPMNAFSDVLSDTTETDVPAGVPEKPEVPLTSCQKEAAGLKPVQRRADPRIPGIKKLCHSCLGRQHVANGSDGCRKLRAAEADFSQPSTAKYTFATFY